MAPDCADNVDCTSDGCNENTNACFNAPAKAHGDAFYENWRAQLLEAGFRRGDRLLVADVGKN